MTDKRTTVGVAIAALNEGPDLEATIALLNAGLTVPDKIVVVDDNSLEPVEPRLTWAKNVMVIRTDRRTGSGPAKHLAAAVLDTDVVVVMDSHMRPSQAWLNILLSEHRFTPLAIICPVCKGFDSGAFRGWGAKLEMGDGGFWIPKWATPHNGPECYRVPCMYGGCYLIPREVLTAVGGYAPAYRGYGCEEEYLSLRAWITGYECRVAGAVKMPHNFQRKLNRMTAAPDNGQGEWEQPFNRHIAAQVCFEPGVYERHYKNRIPLTDAVKAQLAINPEQAEAARAHVQKNRRISDADLHRLIGLVHP